MARRRLFNSAFFVRYDIFDEHPLKWLRDPTAIKRNNQSGYARQETSARILVTQPLTKPTGYAGFPVVAGTTGYAPLVTRHWLRGQVDQGSYATDHDAKMVTRPSPARAARQARPNHHGLVTRRLRFLATAAEVGDRAAPSRLRRAWRPWAALPSKGYQSPLAGGLACREAAPVRPDGCWRPIRGQWPIDMGDRPKTNKSPRDLGLLPVARYSHVYVSSGFSEPY